MTHSQRPITIPDDSGVKTVFDCEFRVECKGTPDDPMCNCGEPGPYSWSCIQRYKHGLCPLGYANLFKEG